MKPQWTEAAANLGATRWQYWRHVGGPVLLSPVLGGTLLLFCGGLSAYATAAAMVGSTVPLVTLQIANVLSGNVLLGQEGVGAALALIMIVGVGLVMVVYWLIQRRTSRWLQVTTANPSVGATLAVGGRGPAGSTPKLRAGWIVLILAAIYFIVPLAASFYFTIDDRSTGHLNFDAYSEIPSAAGFVDALRRSLTLALLTVVGAHGDHGSGDARGHPPAAPVAR